MASACMTSQACLLQDSEGSQRIATLLHALVWGSQLKGPHRGSGMVTGQMGSGDKKAQTHHTPCLVNSFPARLEASDHSVYTSIAVQLG